MRKDTSGTSRLERPPGLYLAVSLVFFLIAFAASSFTIATTEIIPPMRSGNALRFDGVDDHVEVRDSPTLDVTRAITIEAWIQPTIMPQKHGGSILVKGYGGGGEAYAFDFGDGAHLRFYIWSPLHSKVHAAVAKGFSMKAGNWYHCVGVYNGSILKVYINGRHVATSSGPKSLDTNDYPLSIGSKESSEGSGYDLSFKGLIDDVRIYDIPLSITKIWRNKSGDVLTQGLVAWWKFDEGSGDLTIDSSPHQNRGVLRGAAWHRHPSLIEYYLGSYLQSLQANEIAFASSAFGFALLSIGLPWAAADVLKIRSNRFREFTSRPLPRRIGAYFKESPSSAPIVVFIITLITTPFIYIYDRTLANNMVTYTFWFLVLGVFWQLVLLTRSRGKINKG